MTHTVRRNTLSGVEIMDKARISVMGLSLGAVVGAAVLQLARDDEEARRAR